MLRNKRILFIMAVAVILFLIPNICNAVNATETTTTSTGKTVKWSYDLEGDNIVNLSCTNISEVTGIVTIPPKIDGHTVVTIGNTKNSYSDGAFENCAGLTGITIPNTVTTIGKEAFYNCVGLKSVVIPDNVMKIGVSAFAYNTGLTSITLGKSLSNIDNYAFNGCTGIKSITIPDSVTTIGNNAFSGCTGIKSITIPNSVTTLGSSAFKNCAGLTSVTLSKNLTVINGGTFEGCKGLKTIIIPDSVTTIKCIYSWGGGAFEDCTNLTKILIPDSVATIEDGAFRDCSKLTIYGNDGQASKQYAEDNDMSFEYISNWNNENAGSDITAPTIKRMEINCNNLSNYYDVNSSAYKIPVGTKITIKVTFDEEITGRTAPTLVIRCGEGKNITLTNGEISSPIITYSYTIKSEDVGQIAVKSFTGGDVKDLVGNEADLTSTKLVAGAVGNTVVYANGTISDSNNTDDNTNNTIQTPEKNNNTNINQNSSNNASNTNGNNASKDNTIKNDSKLPQTGTTLLSLVVISFMVVAIISKVKYGKYKDI